MRRRRVAVATLIAVLATIGATCRGEGPFTLEIRDQAYVLTCRRVPVALLGPTYYRTPSDGYLPILARTIQGVEANEALAVRFTAAHCVSGPTRHFWLMTGEVRSDRRMDEILDILRTDVPVSD